MKSSTIFIVGSGKLANAILNSEMVFPEHEIKKWETAQQKNSKNRCIMVHAGSGRQLKECLEFCSNTKSTFIELSTGLQTETLNPDFPLVVCPNTSILLLKTLSMLKTFGSNFKNYDISITESHQADKRTEPGTAFSFADSLGVIHNEIKSIRDPKIQVEEIGIPDAYLSKHAYHKIIVSDKNDSLTIETKVLGHDSYVNGVESILKTCISHNLEARSYTVLDLIENNIL